MYNYGGYFDKGLGLVKGWIDVCDLLRLLKFLENFRSWFKKY